MLILELEEIRRRLHDDEIIARMREALVAQSCGDCVTPMPMHLETAGGEIHVKASYRRSGAYFALKMAGAASGMILLGSAETTAPLAYLADHGHLTDVRTAAVAALVARELGRRDESIGILGAGVQARLTPRFHARVLPLKRLFVWGRTPERVARAFLPATGIEVVVCSTAAEVAANTRLIVTCTASRAPLLRAGDLHEGTHISAVGADSPGKQELDPEILRRASLLLVDSRTQSGQLGELQRAPEQLARAIEIGEFCLAARPAGGLSVCDMTGLGVEDLFIAEWVYENRAV